MIARPNLLRKIEDSFRITPIVTLLGPRQCGKTTLARMFMDAGCGFAGNGNEGENEVCLFDLEDPADDAALANPMLALRDRKGLVILDEVQRRPDIFPVLRVLADRLEARTRFLLLGSASPSLVKGVSESLAGRSGFVDIGGFEIAETGGEDYRKLWLRGGFPRAWLADSDADSMAWRKGFVRSFLERDIPQLGISIPSSTLSRFWTMIAHYHGQIWNGSELARAMGVSEKSVKRYIEILEGTFVCQSLQPWFENLGKRLVKSPKVFIRDSGILHTLLGIGSMDNLLSHPKAGASWEGFAMGEVLARYPDGQPYYYATHGGAELDLLLVCGGKRYGFEMKLNQAPTYTRSMGIATADLSLDALFVVYPGDKAYALRENARAVPLASLPVLG